MRPIVWIERAAVSIWNLTLRLGMISKSSIASSSAAGSNPYRNHEPQSSQDAIGW